MRGRLPPRRGERRASQRLRSDARLAPLPDALIMRRARCSRRFPCNRLVSVAIREANVNGVTREPSRSDDRSPSVRRRPQGGGFGTPTPRQEGLRANRRREKSGRGTDPLQPPCGHESPAEALRNAHNGTFAGVLGTRGGTRAALSAVSAVRRRRNFARRTLKP